MRWNKRSKRQQKSNDKKSRKAKRSKPKIKLLFKGRLGELISRYKVANEVIKVVESVFTSRYITLNMASIRFNLSRG